MIIMIESGRLGNQIFQYLALRSCVRMNERIRLFGFDQLDIVFSGVEATFTPIANNPLRHFQSVGPDQLKRLVRFLPSTGVIAEDLYGNAIIRGNGRLLLAEPSWFQNSHHLNEPALARMSIRDSWLELAEDVLGNFGMTSGRTAFVHARGGDYRVWPSSTHPAILDPRWFSQQADELAQAVPGLRFIVMGDESAYRSQVAAAIPGAVEVDAGFETEFALMASCSSGILSASTFAFWGAYFAQRMHHSGRFIAPKYWAGHRKEVWFPVAIEAPFLTYA
jgi:hypothetical protein